jgi:hypothetical protein
VLEVLESRRVLAGLAEALTGAEEYGMGVGLIKTVFGVDRGRRWSAPVQARSTPSEPPRTRAAVGDAGWWAAVPVSAKGVTPVIA